MKEIKTFDELFKIEDDKYDEVIRNDLILIRDSIIQEEGFILIIGDNLHTNDISVHLSLKNYLAFTEKEKEYIKRKYF